MMVNKVIGNIKSVRKNLDSNSQVWYKQILPKYYLNKYLEKFLDPPLYSLSQSLQGIE